MSEVKGQLLGMLVVLSIFMAVGVLLVEAFHSDASFIANELTNESLIQVVRVFKSALLK